MNGTVLDASALLAYLLGEPGGLAVSETLMKGSCLVSAVNYAEVITKLADYGVSPAQLADQFAENDIIDLLVIEDFTPEMADVAAGLRDSTRSLGLSLGDRACLALARLRGLPALTADQRWLNVPGVAVKVIR